MVKLEVGKTYKDALGKLHVVLSELNCSSGEFITKFLNYDDQRVYMSNGTVVAPHWLVGNQMATLTEEYVEKKTVEYDILWMRNVRTKEVIANIAKKGSTPLDVTNGFLEIIKRETVYLTA